jgi:hypothetical protein
VTQQQHTRSSELSSSIDEAISHQNQRTSSLLIDATTTVILIIDKDCYDATPLRESLLCLMSQSLCQHVMTKAEGSKHKIMFVERTDL